MIGVSPAVLLFPALAEYGGGTVGTRALWHVRIALGGLAGLSGARGQKPGSFLTGGPIKARILVLQRYKHLQ